MVYKGYFLLTHSYQLEDTKQWVAKGEIKPVNDPVANNYTWQRHFDTKEEADLYATAQMVMIIEGSSKLLTIGDLAKVTGEEIYTIRFWLQEGLIQSIGKTVSGYQLFTEEAITRINKIRLLQKEKRLTIAEMKKYFEHEDKRDDE